MQVKAPLPITLLDGKKTLPIIEAYFEFNHLKQLYRQGSLQHGIAGNFCESVAAQKAKRQAKLEKPGNGFQGRLG